MATTTAVDFYFQSMSRFQVLENDEVIELSRKVQAWQQHEGGPDACSPLVKSYAIAARDKLVRHNMRLVVKVWKDNYATRVTSKDAGLADMLQRATCDLIRAAEKYDASKGHKFSTYAITWIHKGMKDYLACEQRAVRIPSNNYFQIKSALAIQAQRTAAGLPEFTMEELVADMSKTRRNMPSPETLGQWIESYLSTNPRSFAERVGEDTELGDMIGQSVNDEADEDVIADRAREAMGYLTEFERNVLEARFGKKRGSVGRRRVAKLLKSTEEEVEQAEARAIKRVRLFTLAVE